MCRKLSGLLSILSTLVALCCVGCGTAGGPSSGGAAGPSITTQPANQNVPMGLSGSFAVTASGTGLQYQWDRNGVPIPGANASTYTTPATAFSDSGAVLTVVVSNSAGSVTSRPALLTVTARAPKPGDLRFQQVDAASTINGYTQAPALLTSVECPPPGGGGGWLTFPSATGTGFFLGNNPCSWQFEPYALPAGVTGLEMGYAGVAMQNYQGILDGSLFSPFPSPSSTGSVITSLSFLPADNTAALGFIHSDQSTGFDRSQFIVGAVDMQATVTQEGLRGHVVTAVAYDGTQATFFSYGWTGDASAIYEAKVVFTTLDAATDSVQALASDGYILTASGSTQAVDGSGVVLVGTRVQGDTMPRPLLIGNLLTVDPLIQQGYAVVGVFIEFQNNALVLKNSIGER